MSGGKNDGQKSEFKTRFVASGFQERDKLQSDLYSVSKESLKTLLAMAANEDFKLVSMDIRAAFLKEIY